MTLVTAIVVALLVGGVAGTAAPKVPGPLFSLAGVYLYWWHTGFSEPTTLTVVVLTLTVLLTLSGGIIRPAVVSRVGGVSGVSMGAAGVAGLITFFLWGTSGMLLVMVVTVFAVEYARGRDARGSFYAALVVVISKFASKLIRLLLMGAVLAAMLVVIFL